MSPTLSSATNRFITDHSGVRWTALDCIYSRSAEEKELVYIERGIYRGFGFCFRDTPENHLLKYITYRADNKDARRILMRYFSSKAYATDITIKSGGFPNFDNYLSSR